MIIAAMAASVAMGLCSINGSAPTPCGFVNNVDGTTAAVAFKFLGADEMTLMLGGNITGPSKFNVTAAQVNDTFVPSTGECVVAPPKLVCRFTIGNDNHTFVFTENRP